MYCTNCGQPVANDANFCGHCGQRIVRSDHMSSSETTVNDLVANKAEDIIIKDDYIAYSDNLSNDDVPQKTTLLNFKSPHIIEQTESPFLHTVTPQYPKRNEIEKKNGIVLIKEEISKGVERYYYEDCVSGDRSDYFDSSEVITDNYDYILIKIHEKYRFLFHNRTQYIFEYILPYSIEYDNVQIIWKIASDYAAIIAQKNDLYGLIIYDKERQDQQFVITPYYENIKIEADGIIIKQSNKLGLVSYNRRQHQFNFLPCIYDDLLLSFGYIIFKQNGKYGLTERTQLSILPCIFDEIKQISDQEFRVKKNGKYGLLSIKQYFATPCIFDQSDLNHIYYDSIIGRFLSVRYDNEEMFYAINSGKLYTNKKTEHKKQIIIGISIALCMCSVIFVLNYDYLNPNNLGIYLISLILGYAIICFGGCKLIDKQITKHGQFKYVKDLNISRLSFLEILKIN